MRGRFFLRTLAPRQRRNLFGTHAGASSGVSFPGPWEDARQLLEAGAVEKAHDLLTTEIGNELKRGPESSQLALSLLTLELGKSFLQQKEAYDALDAFEHSVKLFESHLADVGAEAGRVEHERYVESLLHLAKLLKLAGQGQPLHHWRLAISHAGKHLGREAYPIAVASLGAAELLLEQLQLPEAERYAAAAAALLARLPPSRATRQRQVEAAALRGVGLAQQQQPGAALQRYEEALEGLRGLEAEQPGLDAWTREAVNSLYRNMEHAHRALGDEAEAARWKQLRDARLTELRDVLLEQQPGVGGKL
jgi:hypothetical protein